MADPVKVPTVHELIQVEDLTTRDDGWIPFHVTRPSCDLCPKHAVFRHPRGGLRCYYCPRPTPKENP